MMKTTIHSAVLIGVLSSFGTISSHSATVEERLKKLEGVVETLQKENTQLRKELGYDPKGPALWIKPAGKPSKVTLGGFIHGQAEFGDAPDGRFVGGGEPFEDRFFVRRARINIQGSFIENFDFKLEGDFSGNTLGEGGGFRAQLTDAYLNWNKLEYANVRAGQFKTPYGFEQLASDTKILTIERSLPNDRLTEGRMLGAGVSGALLAKRLGYMLGIFNGTAVNTSSNDNDNFLYAGRIHGLPLKGNLRSQEIQVSVGVNGLISSDDSAGKAGFPGAPFIPGGVFMGDRYSWGLDAQVKYGPMQIQAEYLNSYFDPSGAGLLSFHADGWYVTGAYDILPRQLQGVVRYETFNPHTGVGGDSTDVWTFGLNYFIKGDDLKLALNYLWGCRAGSSDDSEGRLLARVQVIF